MAHPQSVFVLEDEEEEFLFLEVWQESVQWLCHCCGSITLCSHCQSSILGVGSRVVMLVP